MNAKSGGTAAEAETILLDVPSIHGRKNAVATLLTKAINKHNSGQTALYYIDTKEAAKLFRNARVTMPKIPSAVNGFVSSITDPGSPVKPKIKTTLN